MKTVLCSIIKCCINLMTGSNSILIQVMEQVMRGTGRLQVYKLVQIFVGFSDRKVELTSAGRNETHRTPFADCSPTARRPQSASSRERQDDLNPLTAGRSITPLRTVRLPCSDRWSEQSCPKGIPNPRSCPILW